MRRTNRGGSFLLCLLINLLLNLEWSIYAFLERKGVYQNEGT